MSKTNPLKDLETVRNMLNKLVYSGRNPTVNQVQQAQAALDRLQEHLRSTKEEKP